MSEFSEITRLAFTVPINGAGAGNVTVRPATDGKKWVLYHLYAQVGGATDVTILSGSTALTGAIAIQGTSPDDVLELKNAGVPVLKADEVNEAFVINVSAAVDIDGFALMGEGDT